MTSRSYVIVDQFLQTIEKQLVNFEQRMRSLDVATFKENHVQVFQSSGLNAPVLLLVGHFGGCSAAGLFIEESLEQRITFLRREVLTKRHDSTVFVSELRVADPRVRLLELALSISVQPHLKSHVGN